MLRHVLQAATLENLIIYSFYDIYKDKNDKWND